MSKSAEDLAVEIIMNNYGIEFFKPGETLEVRDSALCEAIVKAIEAEKAEAKALSLTVARMKDALIWCSGSDDFAYPNGKAREGWEKVVKPLIDAPDHPSEKRLRCLEKVAEAANKFKCSCYMGEITSSRLDLANALSELSACEGESA